MKILQSVLYTYVLTQIDLARPVVSLDDSDGGGGGNGGGDGSEGDVAAAEERQVRSRAGSHTCTRTQSTWLNTV